MPGFRCGLCSEATLLILDSGSSHQTLPPHNSRRGSAKDNQTCMQLLGWKATALWTWVHERMGYNVRIHLGEPKQ